MSRTPGPKYVAPGGMQGFGASAKTKRGLASSPLMTSQNLSPGFTVPVAWLPETFPPRITLLFGNASRSVIGPRRFDTRTSTGPVVPNVVKLTLGKELVHQ